MGRSSYAISIAAGWIKLEYMQASVEYRVYAGIYLTIIYDRNIDSNSWYENKHSLNKLGVYWIKWRIEYIYQCIYSYFQYIET